ncbi:MAG: hypothetical protein WKG03_05630, partial [Telluria sp.]
MHDGAPTEVAVNQQRVIKAPWIYIAGEAIIPLLIGAIVALAFLLLPQAREVLFGTIGVTFDAPATGGKGAGHLVGSAFACLLIGIAVFSLATWYCSRLLVTIDTGSHFVDRDSDPQGGLAQATEHLPRLFGAVTAALLVSAVVNTQVGLDASRVPGPLLAGLAGFIPLAVTVFLLRRDSQFWSVGNILAAAGGIGIHLVCLMSGLRDLSQWQVNSALIVLCWIPAVLYAGTRMRRQVLAKLTSAAAVPSASARLPFTDSRRRLAGMGLSSVAMIVILGAISASVARYAGSAAIVLVFCTTVVLLVTVATLLLRRGSHKAPGAVVIGALGLLGVVGIMHASGWSLLTEAIGSGERLEPVAAALGQPLPAAAPVAQDIVVNARGGGLRAGAFTAQVLADLDDRTCGQFGQRLGRMSGVSGGSLGIAVYLTLRQEFMAGGGYDSCTVSLSNQRPLRSLVEKALFQDHLSPVISKMLSSDLVPALQPQRGHALLESWHEGVLTAVEDLRQDHKKAPAISLQGLARPLHQLHGGISPPPLIFFNTTDARSGERLWLTNTSRWGRAIDSLGGAIGTDMQVGEAVLHSARFPVVSPAGEIRLGNRRFVVDAGYADNSGVGTLQDSREALRRAGVPTAEKYWLDVDGNPPGRGSAQADARAGDGWTA